MYIGNFLHNSRTSKAMYAIAVTVICLLCGYGCLVQAHNTLVLDGIKHLQAQDSDRALLDLNDAVGKLPVESHAYFYRALAHEQKGNHVQALRDLDASLQRGESKSRVLIARACIEAAAKNYEKAADACTLAALDEPDNLAAYAVRSSIHAYCHQDKLAKADCDNGLKLCHDVQLRARLLRQRGIAEVGMGQGSAGLADLSGALDLSPDPSIYMLRGDVYRSHQQQQEAVADYTKSLQLQPKSYESLLRRGTCYVALHQDQAALSDFNRALTINPTGEQALIRRGSIYARKNLWQQAANDFQDANNLNPFIKEGQDKLAIAIAHLRSTSPHNSLASAATAKLPADTQKLMELGYRRLKENEGDRAIECFAEAVRREPNNPTARKYLAHALNNNSEFAAAANQLQALSVLSPLDVSDASTLGVCLAKAGRKDEAAAILSRTLRTNPSASQARAELAKIYFETGKTRKARRLCEEGIARASTNSEKLIYEAILIPHSRQRNGAAAIASQGKLGPQ
jgi:tetratricopeptide (TPR) repeat protein